jgi:enterochelin esterase-like enzyme
MRVMSYWTDLTRRGLKLKPVLLCSLFLLAGCLPAQAPPGAASPAPTPTCSTPGTVQWLAVGAVGEIGLYLPPCYDAQAGRLYPALYLLPGFSGTAHDWFGDGLAPTANTLILSGEIPPFLIVTTPDTFADFEGDAIVQTLLPYLEGRYHASSERRHRAVGGGSLGGASAYHLVFKHPDLFASAGIFGAGAARGEEDAILGWLSAIPAEDRPRVFLNCGEGDTDMLQRAKVLISLLDQAGIAHMEIFSPGGHSGAYWSSNLPAYFRWLAQDW